jgi:hypothetical protein
MGADDDCDWGRDQTAVPSRPAPHWQMLEQKHSTSHNVCIDSKGRSQSRTVSHALGRRAMVVSMPPSSSGGKWRRVRRGREAKNDREEAQSG